MKEKILTLPHPFGGDLELYKNTWGKSGEPLSIVSGLQGDHLNGMFRVPQNSITALQLVLSGLGDPVFCCQLVQCHKSLTRSQLRIPAP